VPVHYYREQYILLVGRVACWNECNGYFSEILLGLAATRMVSRGHHGTWLGIPLTLRHTDTLLLFLHLRRHFADVRFVEALCLRYRHPHTRARAAHAVAL
jgi:hypothetical protein